MRGCFAQLRYPCFASQPLIALPAALIKQTGHVVRSHSHEFIWRLEILPVEKQLIRSPILLKITYTPLLVHFVV